MGHSLPTPIWVALFSAHIDSAIVHPLCLMKVTVTSLRLLQTIEELPVLSQHQLQMFELWNWAFQNTKHCFISYQRLALTSDGDIKREYNGLWTVRLVFGQFTYCTLHVQLP